MKSSKKRSRAVVTVVACILAVCLVAALVLFSLVNSKVRALQKGAAFEFSYNITAQDSSSTPALYNILKQVGATSGDVAGLRSREIVEQLDIKDSTLRFHNKNIYEKLGVSSLKQLQQFVAILNSGSGSAPDSAPDEK